MRNFESLVSFMLIKLLFFNSVVNFVNCEIIKDQAVEDFIAKHSGNNSEVDLTTWEPPEEFTKNFVYYLSGFDEEDRPIWVAEWGKWDSRKYVEAGGEKLKMYGYYFDQQMIRILQSIKLRSTEKNPVQDVIFIIDFENYPLEQIASPKTVTFLLGKIAGWSEVGHTLHKGIVINSNFLAERLINLSRPILGGLFSRFDVYGTNKALWLPRVLQHVPKSQIPEWYGGEKDYKPIKVYGR